MLDPVVAGPQSESAPQADQVPAASAAPSGVPEVLEESAPSETAASIPLESLESIVTEATEATVVTDPTETTEGTTLPAELPANLYTTSLIQTLCTGFAVSMVCGAVLGSILFSRLGDFRK